MAFDVGSLASATPWGAGISAAAQIASAPPPSQTAQGSTGAKTFGGINTTSVPKWVWPVGFAFAGLLAVLYFRRK